MIQSRAMSIRYSRLGAFFFVISGLSLSAAGELPWPTKTGPHYNGTPLAEHTAGLPVTWREETGQNIAWKIDVEGAGHSTPVIGNGRIWLTSATEDGKRQFVYCIDSKSGEVLHHKLLFENANPEPL